MSTRRVCPASLRQACITSPRWAFKRATFQSLMGVTWHSRAAALGCRTEIFQDLNLNVCSQARFETPKRRSVEMSCSSRLSKQVFCDEPLDSRNGTGLRDRAAAVQGVCKGEHYCQPRQHNRRLAQSYRTAGSSGHGAADSRRSEAAGWHSRHFPAARDFDKVCFDRSIIASFTPVQECRTTARASRKAASLLQEPSMFSRLKEMLRQQLFNNRSQGPLAFSASNKPLRLLPGEEETGRVFSSCFSLDQSHMLTIVPLSIRSHHGASNNCFQRLLCTKRHWACSLLRVAYCWLKVFAGLDFAHCLERHGTTGLASEIDTRLHILTNNQLCSC